MTPEKVHHQEVSQPSAAVEVQANAFCRIEGGAGGTSDSEQTYVHGELNVDAGLGDHFLLSKNGSSDHQGVLKDGAIFRSSSSVGFAEEPDAPDRVAFRRLLSSALALGAAYQTIFGEGSKPFLHASCPVSLGLE